MNRSPGWVFYVAYFSQSKRIIDIAIQIEGNVSLFYYMNGESSLVNLGESPDILHIVLKRYDFSFFVFQVYIN